MFTKTFFKLFPPPKYLNIPYAGLDISDDAIRCIEYASDRHGYTINKFGERKLPKGAVEGGRIVDESVLEKELKSLVDELKVGVVKASLPEERMYLFKSEVPDADEDEIRQNIEFKLEENVPMPASEAIFFFDLLKIDAQKKRIASISVAPRELVHQYLKVIEKAGLSVVSFEIQPKAIAKVLVPTDTVSTQMIVNIMERKTGLYVVCGNVVCFTSTIPWGAEILRDKKTSEMTDDIFTLRHEIERVYGYWSEHGEGESIRSIIISGTDSQRISQISHLSPDPKADLVLGDVWQNTFSTDKYIPPINFEDSLKYAVAAGLALP